MNSKSHATSILEVSVRNSVGTSRDHVILVARARAREYHLLKRKENHAISPTTPLIRITITTIYSFRRLYSDT
jgi:hypothetical protein